jgi:ATP-dependent RNA helicase DeaD
MTFAEQHAHPSLQRALEEKGYTQPTAVQAAVLAAKGDSDLLVSAETGSGKTVAFGLAMAATLLGEKATLDRPRKPLALVIAPTRELAMQVQRELSWLFLAAGGRTAACVGGMEMRRELQALSAGAHIVVGTPGRLVDHLERGSLDLSELKALVLDEADEMLDMGFREELERILSDAPKERRTLLFSATLPPEIDQLARRYQRDAQRIAATPTHQQHRDIEYRAHIMAMREREHAVVNILRAHDAPSSIVFCKTREAVNHLHANLIERGFAAVALSGELTQSERTRALKALRDGRARVLVATDVAARGLDLPDVSLVIHADLPNDAQVLQHRSGRTGRAGKKGVSVLLSPPSSRRHAEKLLAQARVKIPWTPVPTAEQIHAMDENRIVTEILALPLEIEEEDVSVAKRLLAERTPEQLAAFLAAVHREKLPAPEDLPLSSGAVTTATSTRRPPMKDSSFTREPTAKTAYQRPPPGAAPAPRAAAPAPVEHAERPERTPPAARPPRAATSHAPSARAHAPTSVSDEPVRAAPRAPPVRSGGTKASAWFSINVGRSAKADPKWLVPLICRRGDVTKADIGAIRIFADETKIEISHAAAQRFTIASARPDKTDPKIKFSPTVQPSATTFTTRAKRPKE